MNAWRAVGLTVLMATGADAALQASAGAAAQRGSGGIRACSLLTKDEVKRLVGMGNQFFDQAPADEEALPGGGSTCNYANVHIQIDPFPFSTIERMRQGQPAGWTTVSGVGDEAYLRNNRGQYAELYVRAGQHVVTVQLDMDPPHEVLEKARPAAAALASALIARLPR